MPALSSSGVRRASRAAGPPTRGVPAGCRTRRCLRARLTSRFISKRIRLRVSGSSARRTPWASDAAFTTVSRSTRSAKSAVLDLVRPPARLLRAAPARGR